MDGISAEELGDFKTSLRSAFGTDKKDGEIDSDTVRRLMGTADGWERSTWKRLAGELELPGLVLAPEHGGGGFAVTELVHVFEEAGAASLCAPLFSTAGLAVPLLLALGDAAALAEYGPGVSDGSIVATVAVAERDGRWDPTLVRATATPAGEGFTLTGGKGVVVDGATADLLLVVAREGGQEGPTGVYAVRGNAAGLEREPLIGLDQTRRLAAVRLTGTPAVRIGPADAAAALRAATDVSLILLAAEQTGGAQRCLDMAAAYARTRVQFGRAIGSFQAIKQHLAELLVKVESSRSAVYAAARIAVHGPDEGEPTVEAAARIAALTAAETFVLASAQNIQIHGGIGFTWEHDAHLFFKRARTSAQALGTEGQHVEALAQLLEAELATT
jgi:alkylation response protein AidB-like acyl-CoA dehydrogenase